MSVVPPIEKVTILIRYKIKCTESRLMPLTISGRGEGGGWEGWGKGEEHKKLVCMRADVLGCGAHLLRVRRSYQA